MNPLENQPDPIRNIGNRKQLFIDGRFIERSRGVSLTVNPPAKKEKVLNGEKPWETGKVGCYTTVVEDQGLYKMWYDALAGTGIHADVARSMCYATSTDGIHWERPNVGLFNWQGHGENNIVMPGGCGGVMVDPRAPDEHRYKAVGILEGGERLWPEARDAHWDLTGGGIHLLTSPDGLRWKRVLPVASPFFHDSQNQLMYDDQTGKYAAYLRTHTRGRTVGRVELDDPLQTPWPFRKPPAEIQPNQYGLYLGASHGEFDTVMACDKLDAPWSDVQVAPVVKYAWAEEAYLSMFTLYRHYAEVKADVAQSGKTKNGKFPNDGPQDVQLAVSRDGIKWARPSRHPYIGLGLEGEWDGGCIWPSLGMIRSGDEIWQYYAATEHTHGYHDPNLSGGGGLCRLVQRLDGFVSADAGYEGGEIVTPLLTFAGTQLELNVNCSAQGLVAVEIQNEWGWPIHGYTLGDAAPIDRNHTAAPMRWREKENVGELAGTPVRLRFKMKACKLYAFQFTTPR